MAFSGCLKNYYYLQNTWFFVFKRHFQQYSAMSWRPVLVVEEAGVPGEKH